MFPRGILSNRDCCVVCFHELSQSFMDNAYGEFTLWMTHNSAGMSSKPPQRILPPSVSDRYLTILSRSLTLNLRGYCTAFPSQIYETQLNELSNQTQTLSAEVASKDALLEEARELINNKVL